MKMYIVSSSNSGTGIIGAKVGDKILDTKTGKVGTVVNEGQSGNYDIVYIDFGGANPRKVNPMDDAQRFGRYEFADEEDRRSGSSVNASSDSQRFLKWHDDPNNYNEDRFDKIYAILDKYGTEDDPVDEVFERATPEDQHKLLGLARPVASSGSAQYIIEKYREAYSNSNDDYFNGWLDAINAMIDANCLSEDIVQAIRREQQA